MHDEHSSATPVGKVARRTNGDYLLTAAAASTGSMRQHKHSGSNSSLQPAECLQPAEVYLPDIGAGLRSSVSGPAAASTSGAASSTIHGHQQAGKLAWQETAATGRDDNHALSVLTLTPLFLLTMQGRGWDGLMRQARFVRMIRNMLGVHHVAFIRLAACAEETTANEENT